MNPIGVKKKRKIEWHKVTWYSKLVALVVVTVLPICAFYLGLKYQEAFDNLEFREIIAHNVNLEKSINEFSELLKQKNTQLQFYQSIFSQPTSSMKTPASGGKHLEIMKQSVL